MSDSILIDVDAETIWQQIADPAQMSRFSPENTGATAPVGRWCRSFAEFQRGNVRRTLTAMKAEFEQAD